VLCYLLFLGTFLCAIGFVENAVVPKSIDSGPVTSFGTSLLVNLLLLGLFAVQHSMMARPQYLNLRGQSHTELGFRTPFLYKFIRHPIMLGFLMAFWFTPHMTAGLLLFAGMTSAYILIALQLEERDLLRYFGDTYREYRKRTPMFIPRLFKK